MYGLVANRTSQSAAAALVIEAYFVATVTSVPLPALLINIDMPPSRIRNVRTQAGG